MDNEEQGSEVTEEVVTPEEAAPPEESVPAEAPPEEAAPAEETVPAAEETVPAAEETVPAAEETAPAEEPVAESIIEPPEAVVTLVPILQLKPGNSFEYGGDNYGLVSLVALVKNLDTGVFGNIDPGVLVKKT